MSSSTKVCLQSLNWKEVLYVNIELKRHGRSTSLSIWLNLESLWEHTSQCICEKISRKTCLRKKAHPESEHSISWAGTSDSIKRRNCAEGQHLSLCFLIINTSVVSLYQHAFLPMKSSNYKLRRTFPFLSCFFIKYLVTRMRRETNTRKKQCSVNKQHKQIRKQTT